MIDFVDIIIFSLIRDTQLKNHIYNKILKIYRACYL